MDRKPEPFLEVIVHEMDIKPGLTGLSVGYESGEWRCNAFADHLMEWLPEFALTWRELENLGKHNVVKLLRRAAHVVYTTEKYSRRGEFGELLLHVALRQIFDTIPAISKLYYKTATNDTVKGFDAVHIVVSGNSLELWLGEVKFYKNINSAMNHVISEIKEHTEREYLRGEFALIINKIDDSSPHSKELKKLLDPNTSLDDIFDCICIPVLLTYESETIKSYSVRNGEYIEAFKAEILQYYKAFSENTLIGALKIHLFLVPLKDKELLVNELHKRLHAWQTM